MSLDREVTPEQLREAIARVKFWHRFSGAPPESYEAYPADIIALIQAAERGMEYEKALKEIALTCEQSAYEGSVCSGKSDCRIAEHYYAYKALASDPPQGKEEER